MEYEYTTEERSQIGEVTAKLEELRTLCSRLDSHELPGRQATLTSYANDIIDNVVPLAERLGLHSAQMEMQDNAVRLGYPEDYARLKQLLLDSEAMCETVFKTFSLPIKSMLDALGIEYTLQYRMKSVFSIWRKMRIDHKEFDDVYDLFAARIVYKVPEDGGIPWREPTPEAVQTLKSEAAGYEETLDLEKLYCWRIYNVVAMLYRIHPDRIKDWVTHPKKSGYQALQMTVMGPDCNWIEIQLRSERMDYEAEYGVAAHWKYKEETADKLKLHD